jgi:hypothetical protein
MGRAHNSSHGWRNMLRGCARRPFIGLDDLLGRLDLEVLACR